MISFRSKRRIVQIFIFCMMFIIPVLNLLEIYFIKGTFVSLDIGSLGISDPVMILQAVIASSASNGVLAVSALIPILLAFFFGRVWCSWACPYTLIAEWIEKIPAVGKVMRRNHTKLQRDGVIKRTMIARYFIFIMFLFIVGICGVPILHLFSPPAIISTQALLLVKNSVLTVEIVFLIALLIIEVFFSYRFACRYLCPTGTCLSLFKSRASLRVSYKGNCIECAKCIAACPMGLNPKRDEGHSLCINCGECIGNCSVKSAPLSWKIGR